MDACRRATNDNNTYEFLTRSFFLAPEENIVHFTVQLSLKYESKQEKLLTCPIKLITINKSPHSWLWKVTNKKPISDSFEAIFWCSDDMRNSNRSFACTYKNEWMILLICLIVRLFFVLEEKQRWVDKWVQFSSVSPNYLHGHIKLSKYVFSVLNFGSFSCTIQILANFSTVYDENEPPPAVQTTISRESVQLFSIFSRSTCGIHRTYFSMWTPTSNRF